MAQPHSTGVSNRLAAETSPYLLQHQHNPVDWWPWGPEALAHARGSGRPILLSVGYAACHWCHVMAHESFEDPATAAVMNELFVNIKVDREERPDIDQIYMAALHHLGEHGGWPLTMFLTPAGEPVWGGTYFPKTARYGKPAFVDVLRELARLFREAPERIDQNRGTLMQRLASRARPQGKATVGPADLDRVASHILQAVDDLHGGIGEAPKFPQAPVFELLWRAGLRTGDPRYFSAVELSLDHMCQGGIYDHLGGGLSRYSVDARWLVPHFEKMLYDNAQLLDLLASAWTRTKRPLYLERATETVGWIAREMTLPGGAFASSLDADSEGEEGKFYVWSLGEIEQVLGPDDTTLFAEHYDVTVAGNFEGHNILNLLNRLPRSTARSKTDDQQLAAMRAKLLAAREKRIRPGLDDKILADWNGLMITGLVHAGLAFEQPNWLARAAGAFRFVCTSLQRDDRLGHSWREGRLVFPGLASDFAGMIRAALALHEATGEADYLQQALTWQRALERHYADDHTGGYFLTADDAEGLVVRPAATTDDPVPNHNAIAAANLLRLAVLTGDDTWRERADRLFDGLLPLAVSNLFAHAGLLNALDLRMRAAEIVVVGDGPAARALTEAALALPYLETIVLRAPSPDRLPATHPIRQASGAVARDTAYACLGQRCSLPVATPQALGAAVTAMRTPPADPT